MLNGSRSALVVDRALVTRHLITRFLTSRHRPVTSAASIEEAREHGSAETPSLVVLDATLEGSFDWFSEWSGRSPKPAFVIITHRPSDLEEASYSLGGTIGYLAKPVSFHALARALATASPTFEESAPRARVLPLAEVSLRSAETGEQEVSCEVRDLGVHGAFLAAAAPIALGTPLRLCLQLGTQRISLGARVARIQEPAWGVTSGWGVAFEHVDAASVRAVEAFVHEALRAAACRSMMRAVAVPDVTCANKRA